MGAMIASVASPLRVKRVVDPPVKNKF